MARAFVIRPFNVKTDGAGNSIDFERVHKELIEPALDACRLAGSTTGEIVEPGNIREDMFSLIIEADIVICDFTIHNANVFYELGIRHALRKRRTVLIKGKPADATPFDILTDRYVAYEANAPAQAVGALIDTINAALASERETDSPIFKMLPRLEEPDVAKLQVVPLTLREEVDRALAAQSKGWLRLLAHDVQQRRFASAALLMIAHALWTLNDHDAARETYESIRDTSAFDPTANLALANIYERLYKRYRKPEFLTESDHSIARVLESPETELKHRVEALALRGRNEKTRWREQFEKLTTVQERRSTATSEMLRSSYSGYADAFRENLNHFWSGVAALQMGVVFLDLTKDEGWTSSFANDDDASQYHKIMARDVATLEVVVGLSIDAALKTLKLDDADRVWANISKADHLFLTENLAARVIKQYLSAVPAGHPFAWGAARGQLELFESLGVRATLARQVIDAVDARNSLVAPRTTAAKPVATGKPAHVVIFAGHQFDEPDRTEARFPKTLERPAYDAILDFLRRLQETDHVIGLASGSVGADILFHEACRELQVTSTMCLPIPTDQYVEATARDLAWRSRLRDLIKQKQALEPPALLELHKAPGLPAWLHGSGTNEWERGNRWVLEMAVTAGAPKVTLLVVWDEQETGDLPGGTAHMVSLARARAGVDIVVISTAGLMTAAPTTTF
jgi:hypothetical protein